MSHWEQWAAFAFWELPQVIGCGLMGAFLGGAAGCAVWRATFPPDAPHGGGLALPGMFAFGAMIGALVGASVGLVGTARRARRAEPPREVGTF